MKQAGKEGERTEWEGGRKGKNWGIMVGREGEGGWGSEGGEELRNNGRKGERGRTEE